MDPLYLALSLYRRRRYDKCAEVCTGILDKQPLDQAAWCLKMRALTQKVYVDDLESEEVPEIDFLDDNVLATAPRPGTSMKTAVIPPTGALSARPRTSTGRPMSGVARLGTHVRPESALDRARTARPLTSTSRSIRLGTAAMLTQKDGPFIQVSRLNLAKYADNPCLSKPLFEYLFFCDGEIRAAMELAVQATQRCRFDDWWWKVQLARCYSAVNLIREAEQQLRSAVKQHYNVETFVRLARIYSRVDQPLSAIDICKSGLEIFPKDVTIMTELGRLYEGLNETNNSVRYYRNILIEDAINIEAVASLGMHHFYNNQPELALKYYRRALSIGAHSGELYNNLGLCCLFSQQFDFVLPYFQRALELATEASAKAEVWYNLSHVAMAAGDVQLAVQCLNLCLSSDAAHAPAFNNLAVLYHKMGKTSLAKAYLNTAKSLEPELGEVQGNLEYLQKL